ncbi:hypothetical protein M3Y97_01100800 [Aphelenchoides bicaudatus]|nr:hypothetical protein M3Y97_01100800 [Aphelenchoides bicaudatus]
MGDSETKGLPYGADYAKTSRSKCKDKECDLEINAGDLRLSARTKSNFHDGLQDNWFHAECFWKHARRGINEALIRCFEHLKWKDQESLRARIKRKAETAGDEDTNKKPTKTNYSVRGGTCMACKAKMEKGDLRVEYKNAHYHPKCAADQRLFLKPADELVDFELLKDEDKDVLRALFTGPNENDIKKEEDAKDDQEKLEDSEEHKEKLKKQTNLIWETKEALESAIRENKEFKGAKGKKEAAEALLKYNGGNAYRKGTLEDFIQLLADIIVFGGFEKCPECGEANFYYSPDRRVYQCAGKGRDDPCSYFSRDIARKPFQTNKATSKTPLSKYNGKTLISGGPSRKRKPEPEGPVRENGFAVDPYFGNPNDFHVYVDEDGNPCQYLLHKIDDKTKDKKFYKIQLLEADSEDEWRVFRRYGVVLTDSTKDMVTNFEDLESAMKLFEGQFREKTGMDWAKREEKKPDQDFSGTYGRTSNETREEDALLNKKKAKVEDDDDY